MQNEMTSYTLKWIAIITMFLDHLGAIILPQYAILRIIGRVAFPIFCFLLVEGFYHTSNLKKYMLRLGIFAIVSEIPFDWMVDSKRSIWLHQNIFFTLLIGLVVLSIIRYTREKYEKKPIAMLSIEVTVIIVGTLISKVIHSDYEIVGVLYILVFYFYRGRNELLTMWLLIVTFCSYGQVTTQLYSVLAMIFISMYNGKKGKSMKYFFYSFYPVHILLLCIIRLMLR